MKESEIIIAKYYRGFRVSLLKKKIGRKRSDFRGPLHTLNNILCTSLVAASVRSALANLFVSPEKIEIARDPVRISIRLWETSHPPLP